MVDPVKEVSAAEKRIAIGISTRQRETTEMMGGDFESNVVQLSRENEMMKAAGLTASSFDSVKNEKKEESEEESDEEEGDEDEGREGNSTGTVGKKEKF